MEVEVRNRQESGENGWSEERPPFWPVETTENMTRRALTVEDFRKVGVPVTAATKPYLEHAGPLPQDAFSD